MHQWQGFGFGFGKGLLLHWLRRLGRVGLRQRFWGSFSFDAGLLGRISLGAKRRSTAFFGVNGIGHFIGIDGQLASFRAQLSASDFGVMAALAHLDFVRRAAGDKFGLVHRLTLGSVELASADSRDKRSVMFLRGRAQAPLGMSTPRAKRMASSLEPNGPEAIENFRSASLEA